MKPTCGESPVLDYAGVEARVMGHEAGPTHDQLDHLHYGPAGAQMEGCLIADAVLSAEGMPDAPEPELDGEGVGPKAVWMMTTKEGTLVPDASEGWEMRQGGRNGSKRWIGSSRAGAVARFDIPAQSVPTQLQLLYYQHRVNPMGLLRAELFPTPATSDSRLEFDGEPVGEPVLVDACLCPLCPPGQGYYAPALVAPMVPPNLNVSLVVTMVEREASSCEALGSDFSIVGLVGKTLLPVPPAPGYWDATAGRFWREHPRLYSHYISWVIWESRLPPWLRRLLESSAFWWLLLLCCGLLLACCVPCCRRRWNRRRQGEERVRMIGDSEHTSDAVAADAVAADGEKQLYEM